MSYLHLHYYCIRDCIEVLRSLRFRTTVFLRTLWSPLITLPVSTYLRRWRSVYTKELNAAASHVMTHSINRAIRYQFEKTRETWQGFTPPVLRLGHRPHASWPPPKCSPQHHMFLTVTWFIYCTCLVCEYNLNLIMKLHVCPDITILFSAARTNKQSTKMSIIK